MGRSAEEITEGLGTRVVGRRVEVHQELDSTNLEALRRAQEGAGEGLVVVARTQTAGRGRRGRSWADVPGGSLLFSVLLRPPAGAEGLLTAAAALSAAEAVRQEVRLPAQIRWPNDLVLQGRKFGGVLAEGSEGELAAVGVGVNVNGRPPDLPSELHSTAGFLSAAAGRDIGLLPLLQAVLCRLDENYLLLRQGKAGALVKRIEQLDCVIGREVSMLAEGKQVSGLALGWRPTGALAVRDEQGRVHEFHAGEVTVR